MHHIQCHTFGDFFPHCTSSPLKQYLLKWYHIHHKMTTLLYTTIHIYTFYTIFISLKSKILRRYHISQTTSQYFFVKLLLQLLNWLYSAINIAGCSCQWHYLLAASLGYWEKGASFHSNVHPICSYYNCNILSILLERDPLLGKVHTQLLFCHNYNTNIQNRNIYMLSYVCIYIYI